MGLFFKRLLGHLYQVITEFLYAVLKLRIHLPVACAFFVMRLTTPFGVSRGWDAPGRPSESPSVDPLRADGIADLAPLAPQRVANLHRFFCDRMGQANGRAYADLRDYFDSSREQRIQRPPGVIATGRQDCAISQVLFEDYYIDIAASFLGLDRSRLIATGSMDALIRLEQPREKTGGYDDALEFHRDIDSYRFVKMFVYLTDCALNGGHHEIYLESHRHTPAVLGPIARYTNEEIEKAIPQARLHRVVGKAGYAFVENTYAFHRGTRPLTGDRLILNLQYMEDTFLDYYKTAFRVPGQDRRAIAA